MKNSEFRSMNHQVGNYEIATNGSQVSQGYKPDITIKNSNGETIYILESEQKTDRKAFIGDVIKAEKYAQEYNFSPVLVIVMKEFNNTTVKQIADHLKPYVTWLSHIISDGLKLKKVIIISDNCYKKSVGQQEVICSENFLRRAEIIEIKL